MAVKYEQSANRIKNLNGITGRRVGETVHIVVAKESLPGKQEAEKGVAAIVEDDQEQQQYQDP